MTEIPLEPKKWLNHPKTKKNDQNYYKTQKNDWNNHKPLKNTIIPLKKKQKLTKWP